MIGALNGNACSRCFLLSVTERNPSESPLVSAAPYSAVPPPSGAIEQMRKWLPWVAGFSGGLFVASALAGAPVDDLPQPSEVVVDVTVRQSSGEFNCATSFIFGAD